MSRQLARRALQTMWHASANTVVCIPSACSWQLTWHLTVCTVVTGISQLSSVSKVALALLHSRVTKKVVTFEPTVWGLGLMAFFGLYAPGTTCECHQ